MDIKALRDKRASLWNQMEEIVTSEDKFEENPAEARAKYDALEADLDAVTKDIDVAERHEARRTEMEAPEGDPEIRVTPEGKKVSADQYRETFEKYLRFGMVELDSEERAVLRTGYDAEARAQGVGTTTAGGYTVDSEMASQIVDALKAFGGMRAAKTNAFSTSTGGTLEVPTLDETSQKGAILAENVAAPEQDLTFGQKTLSAHKYTSKMVKVSVELLQDSEYDIASEVSSALGTRIARITNEHFTSGTGTGQPEGVVVSSGVGKAGATGQTTSVTYDDLVDLVHSIDPAYRDGSEFMFNDSSLKGLRKLKDADNRPLWQPGLTSGEPSTILGHGYVINQDVAAMGASAKSILFGNFGYYWIRDVKGITLIRLDERFAEAHQVAFLGFSRHDGKGVWAGATGNEPIKHYANSAT